MVITLHQTIDPKDANPVLDYENTCGRITYDTIIMGHCVADHIALNDLDFYPLTKMRLLLVNDDILDGWERFMHDVVKDFIDKILERINSKNVSIRYITEEGNYLALFLVDYYEYMKVHPNCSDPYMAVANFIFPDFSSKKELRHWLRLRINWKTRMIRKLQDSLLHFYPAYGIQKQHAERIVHDIKEDNFLLLRRLYEDSKNFFISNGGAVLDARIVGLGSIIFSQTIVNDKAKEVELSGWRNGILDFTINDIAFYYLTKFDATVISHGNKLKGSLHIQPTRSLDGLETYDTADGLINRLWMQGCKRIHLVSCNHFGLTLDPKYYTRKDLLVLMYNGKVLIG